MKKKEEKLETRRFVMIGERSVKSGRIAKNEEYELDEFCEEVAPYFVVQMSLWDRIFHWKHIKNNLQTNFIYSLKDAITYKIINDSFGRKKR